MEYLQRIPHLQTALVSKNQISPGSSLQAWGQVLKSELPVHAAFTSQV